MTNMNPFRANVFAGVLLALLATSAEAQYARPGAQQAAKTPPAPIVQAPAPIRTQAGQQPVSPAGVGLRSPDCFEVGDQNDAALIKALRQYDMLCPTITRSGTPVRLRASAAGDLIAEKGQPTAWMRGR